jgi:hypothetical protein
MTAVAMSGVILLMIHNNVCFDNDLLLLNDDWSGNSEACIAGRALQLISIVTSAILLLLLVQYYRIAARQERYQVSLLRSIPHPILCHDHQQFGLV